MDVQDSPPQASNPFNLQCDEMCQGMLLAIYWEIALADNIMMQYVINSIKYSKQFPIIGKQKMLLCC